MMDHITKNINHVYSQAKEELDKIDKTIKDIVKRNDELEQFRIKYLGRKGELNKIFKEISTLRKDVKKDAGAAANSIKEDLLARFKLVSKNKQKIVSIIELDETIPGKEVCSGSLHPITQFIHKIVDVFASMGFEVVEDRESETVEYNFDKLNIADDHPARDMWDTFYIKNHLPANGKIKDTIVMRTHTSPVQLRAMEKRKVPVRLIVPGRVYRHEATDASHETCFYQLEGLVIDKEISVANMIYILQAALRQLFGKEVKIRIRPSFFPFVEPGAEVDMSCIICEQKGCSVCSKTGWLEMLGAGMVHPQVLKNMKVDSEKFTGFAFGMGVDRLMMLYHSVNDIRLSYSGDLRFLKQF